MDDNKKSLVYHLKKWMVICLFFYYSFTIIVGIMVLSKMLMEYDFDSEIMKYTLIASFFICLTTSSMQYMKRLYKACIQERVVIETEDANWNTRFIGNFVYFLLRPFFACVFVLIMVFGVKAGVIVIVSPEESIVNERFFYICVTVAAGIGFSVGKVLNGFEVFTEKKINRLIS